MSPQEKIPPSHIPSMDEVGAAYSQILDHNERHAGIGVAFRGILKASIHGEVIDYEEAGDTTTGSAALLNPEESSELEDKAAENIQRGVVEGDMDADLQEILHADIFMRIGIKISPFGQTIKNGLEERSSSTELLPAVNNTELYKEFLENIKPDEVNIGNQQFFANVLGTLQKIIEVFFDNEQLGGVPPEDRRAARQYGEDALRTFVAIAPEYKRLGLDAESLRRKLATRPEGTYNFEDMHNKTGTYLAHQAYEQAQTAADTYDTLEAYVEYWGRDLLSEYMAIDSVELLEAPATRYLDGVQHRLTEKVDEIIRIPESGRTHNFKTEAATALLAGVEKGIKEMDNNPDAWHASDENRELLKLTAVRLRDFINNAGS